MASFRVQHVSASLVLVERATVGISKMNSRRCAHRLRFMLCSSSAGAGTTARDYPKIR